MQRIETIDVKGLDHADKERLIFGGVGDLQPNDRARIVVEFNPLPLVYMLKTQDLDVGYEKEGPDEWVLLVSRKGEEPDKKAQFRELLTGLRTGAGSEEMKARAKDLLGSVDATTLGLMEQELIREGVSHDEIRQSLCDIHLEAIRDSLVSKRIEVAAPHPVNTLMEEHKHIVADLKELAALVARLRTQDSYESMGSDFDALRRISHHLVEAESHHRREEEAIFPRLEKRDIVEPPQIMKLDHVEFRQRKHALHELAHHSEQHAFPEFKARVAELGEYLARELDSHIFKEDNILYQIALQVLTPAEWEEVKAECDRIGYCCFTPQDHKNGDVLVELDLRSVVPFERHEKIFANWEALKPGSTLRITNDHDPKPLRYQFAAEQAGHFEWQYKQQGPKDWVVEIKKV